LEWDKQAAVTIEDAVQILGISYDHARQVLHRLARDRWLAMVRPGKYELIPAERGEYAFPDTNPLFLGSLLVEPYYFTYSTAAFFHGLSTQAGQTVYLAATRGRTHSMLVREKEYRVVIQPEHKFFGYFETDAYGSRVNMAEPEKTVLDSLDRPDYAGDIPEVAGMLQLGKSRLDWQKLVEYAVRFQSQSLLQRLGYLIDRLNLAIDPGVRDQLLAVASGNTKCYLGQPRRWHTGGDYNATWRIVDNIPRQHLLSEIEVS
jgi:predicted transcriptional regulator of viral defense system